MKVSLVIPVYNESGHLLEFLKQVDALRFDGVQKELVIIDDCSKDESANILRTYNFSSEVQLHFQDANAGKGAAIRKGFELATGDIIGVQDADFEYSLDDLPSIGPARPARGRPGQSAVTSLSSSPLSALPRTSFDLSRP